MKDILIFAVIIGFMVHIDCQSISFCANPVNGQSCAITCNTTDFSQDVQFLLGTSGQGSCTVIGGSSACGPGLSQSGTITTLTIATLSRGTHEGEWSCKFGTATSSPKSLVVSTVPSTVEVTQTFPNVNLTEEITEVKVSAECHCIYPSTSDVKIIFKKGVSESQKTVPTAAIISNLSPGPPCLSDEYKIEISNYSVSPSSITGPNVYLQVQFGSYKTADYGVFNFAATTNGKGSLFLHAFLPVFLIVLIGINIFFVLTWCVCKDGPFKQGSMKRCCPSNIVCNVVCPMCTKPKAICSCCSGVSFIVQCAISVVVFLFVAAIIGVIIAFGLGLESGKDDLALGLSIVFGIVLVVIYIISVYPRLAYAPNERENGGSRIGIMEDTKKTGGDQGRGRQNPTGSTTPTSASAVRLTNASREGVHLANETK